jgi:hypothetical protein
MDNEASKMLNFLPKKSHNERRPKLKNLKKQEKFNISYSTGNGAPIKPGSYKDIREL